MYDIILKIYLNICSFICKDRDQSRDHMVLPIVYLYVDEVFYYINELTA